MMVPLPFAGITGVFGTKLANVHAREMGWSASNDGDYADQCQEPSLFCNR